MFLSSLFFSDGLQNFEMRGMVTGGVSVILSFFQIWRASDRNLQDFEGITFGILFFLIWNASSISFHSCFFFRFWAKLYKISKVIPLKSLFFLIYLIETLLTFHSLVWRALNGKMAEILKVLYFEILSFLLFKWNVNDFFLLF